MERPKDAWRWPLAIRQPVCDELALTFSGPAAQHEVAAIGKASGASARRLLVSAACTCTGQQSIRFTTGIALAVSVTDHPWPRRRECLGAAFGLGHKARRLAGTAATPRTMRCLVFAECPGRIGTALIGGVGLPFVRRHAEKIRCGQDRARRDARALRAILRLVAFRHRPHVRERTTIIAEIVVGPGILFYLRG